MRNNSSSLAPRATPHTPAAGASKAALAAVNRCLAAEWAKAHIPRVNGAPGYIDTDIARDYLALAEVKAYLDREMTYAARRDFDREPAAAGGGGGAGPGGGAGGGGRAGRASPRGCPPRGRSGGVALPHPGAGGGGGGSDLVTRILD